MTLPVNNLPLKLEGLVWRDFTGRSVPTGNKVHFTSSFYLNDEVKGRALQVAMSQN